jgi:hypothetical protein
MIGPMPLAQAEILFPCAIPLVMIVWALIYVKLFGAYSLGKRRYKTIPALVAHVRGLVGLDPTREDGAFPQLDQVLFKGELASGRRAGIRFFSFTVGSSTRTHVLFTVAADETPQLSIKLENVFHKIGKVIGVTNEIEVGDRSFDKRFLLSTTAPERARKALSPELRAVTTKLFDDFKIIELAIREGSLTAELDVDSTDPERYPLILELLDQGARSLDRKEVAVAVFEGKRKAIVDAQGTIVCPFCRENLTGTEPSLVSCERCQTVVHAACWDEHKGCPVFGCAGTTPERARTRQG